MEKRKLKPYVTPIVYGLCIVLFAFSMYFAGTLFDNKDLKEKENELQYVDNNIVDNNEYIPVVSTDVSIVKPFLSTEVTVYKSFYDYQAESEKQQNSILFYEGTYMQNSGIDYTNKEEFDVISILDGTVIDVKEDNILGTTVEIRHNNEIISLYQCLKSADVKVDDTITQGQVIGKSGKSNLNRDSEYNLHFELYYQGKIVNPEEYYNKLLKDL